MFFPPNIQNLKTNRRTDAYSCDFSLNFLHHIVISIREAVPPDFILGVKVSVSDYADTSTKTPHLESGEKDPHRTRTERHKRKQEAEALGHVRTLASWHCIDFIEISGGDYETPGKTIYSSCLVTDSKLTISITVLRRIYVLSFEIPSASILRAFLTSSIDHPWGFSFF